MITLIEHIVAIRNYAKDIHYHAHGDSFYGIHLLMDRVAENLDKYEDDLKEVCYLGEIQEVPSSADILKVAAAYIPEITDDNKENIGRLSDLISTALDDIVRLKGNSPAQDSLLDGLAQDLQLKRGLLWRQK